MQPHWTIASGVIDAATIGATTASTGAFTTLAASGRFQVQVLQQDLLHPVLQLVVQLQVQVLSQHFQQLSTSLAGLVLMQNLLLHLQLVVRQRVQELSQHSQHQERFQAQALTTLLYLMTILHLLIQLK